MTGEVATNGRIAARQAMLGQLTGTLEALVRKLSSQREVALSACALAPQAEQIAQQARLLAFGRGRIPPAAVSELVEAIAAMAADAAEVAQQIERGAALGGAIVSTIGGQLAELVAIARDPVRLADPMALRGVLTALAGTLQRVSTQRQGQDASGEAVLELGRRAVALAERAQGVARGGSGLQDEALRLSRELGSYAEEAARVATTLSHDAAAGEQVLAAMASEIRGIAEPRPSSPTQELDRRITSILRDGAPVPGDRVIAWGSPEPPR